MAHLVFFGGFSEEERTPICYAANHATLGKNEVARCTSDSSGERDVNFACLRVSAVSMARSGRGALFDFIGVVWSAYPNLVYREYQVLDTEKALEALTTAIISYNMTPAVYLHYSEKVDELKHRRLFAS